MSEQLVAGAASIVITPPVGVDLCGYGGRPAPSSGVHDDLRAAALCLQAGESAILMTADLIGIDPESLRLVRERVAAETDVPGANVMLTCSHTHAGPATPCIHHLGDTDEGYLSELRERLTRVAVEAWRARGPARWASGRGRVQVGINRREMKAGQVLIGENPGGTCARHVDVLRVDRACGEPLAVWMNHPAHAVALDHNNTLISADWPGYACRALEQAYPGVVAMFAQGCCGNINCNWRVGFEVTEQLGLMFAEAVREVADGLTPHAEAQVLVASETVALPLQDPPPVAEARAALEQARADREAKWEEGNYGVRKMLDGVVAWSQQILALAEQGATDLTVACEVQAVRLGGLCIVGLPGEVFVEYALKIDAASPCAQTAVAGYTNGNLGYVPTEAAYAEGGYEVDSAIRWYGTTMLAPQTEDIILAAAGRVLERAGGGCGGN